MGNMGLSAAESGTKLLELKYFIEFGKTPSMDDLAREIS